MDLDVRVGESTKAAELYITAMPSAGESVEAAATGAYAAIARLLSQNGARVFQERIFATGDAIPTLCAARAAAYGDLDDGVPPALLAVPAVKAGPVSGIQIHAIRSDAKQEPIALGDHLCGRILHMPTRSYVALSGITAPLSSGAPSQSRALFEQAEIALKSVGGTMFSVSRTWVWLGDILAWYDEFNRVRNGFFTERGLLDGRVDQSQLPASTGIGVRPADGTECGLDVFAVVGRGDLAKFHLAGGRQESPYAYGSAFSRASRATTPAGDTIFVSGTAAIDSTGKTRYADDPKAQIEMTVENVQALLSEMNCRDEDVVHAIAYCKTPEVEEAYEPLRARLPWAQFTVIADVCRDDLHFEIEATALPGARRL